MDIILVEPNPIPNTHLFRRSNDVGEIGAIYRGPGCLSDAIGEAESQSMIRLHYNGADHVKIEGRWYRVNWPTTILHNTEIA